MLEKQKGLLNMSGRVSVWHIGFKGLSIRAKKLRLPSFLIKIFGVTPKSVQVSSERSSVVFTWTGIYFLK